MKFSSVVIRCVAVISGILMIHSCVNSTGNKKSSSGIMKPPRVVISSDIGGSDPDDFQSMIHLLMYADRLRIEGIISSPYGKGRVSDIHHIIDLYEKDYPKLKRHGIFPSPDELRSVVKQGAEAANPPVGWAEPTEGSEWIISQARKQATEPPMDSGMGWT